MKSRCFVGGGGGGYNVFGTIRTNRTNLTTQEPCKHRLKSGNFSLEVPSAQRSASALKTIRTLCCCFYLIVAIIILLYSWRKWTTNQPYSLVEFRQLGYTYTAKKNLAVVSMPLNSHDIWHDIWI